MNRLKKTILVFTTLSMLSGSIIIAEAGYCDHGGANPKVNTTTTITDCVSAGDHPTYVGGRLETCHMYFYRYQIDSKCLLCGKIVSTTYSCSEPLHEYNHTS